MVMKKTFAVIGLGRFGGSITEELVECGQEVLAIDRSEDRVNEYMHIATHAVVGNAQDENVLKTLGIRNFDTVIVAIGEDIQASILVTLMLKELGVGNVWAKAHDNYHAKVLDKIGADQVIHPERDMGKRVAHRVIAKNILDYLEISEKLSMAEVRVTDKKFTNKPLSALHLTSNYGITVAAIRRKEGKVEMATAQSEIHEGDNILILGSTQSVDYFDEQS